MDVYGWYNYADRLAKISKTASDKMYKYLASLDAAWDDPGVREQIIAYAYGLGTKYGEAAAEFACEMYDEVGLLEGLTLPPAIPAPTATYGELAKVINGAMKSLNEIIVADATGRLVKQAAEDTTLTNAARDGAEVAWIPNGDTCAYCVMLASNGWQRLGEYKHGVMHAEHVHANCDCTHAIRHKPTTNVIGYNPDKYKRMYNTADGLDWREKVNSMRREAYAKNSEEINAQKRNAYEKQKEREASAAEEINVN